MEKFANSNCDFALQLFKQVSKDGKSTFLSPASITAALAMTYAGADGETKTQMQKLLFRNLQDKEINEGMHQMISAINTPADGYTLNTANRLYAEKSCQILQSFLDACQKVHHSDCISCDFSGNAEKVAKEINGWVEQMTNEKIKDLIKPGVLDSLTRLVLVNAIYFKGDWKIEFEEKHTAKEQFHVAADKVIDVDMMHMKTKGLLYAHNDKCQLLGMEYKSPNVAMFFLLPMEQHGLKELESSLTGTELMELFKEAHDMEMEVVLPKFRLDSEFELKKPFQELGCAHMFNGADFSKIGGSKDLHVSSIIHKAFVEVNEKGAEAAAATVVNVRARCLHIVPRFVADHPFLFAIVERKTMTILFLGHFYG